MVVIDMDMPESCQDCRAYGTSACDKWDKHRTFSDQRTKRHKDCPIVGEFIGKIEEPNMDGSCNIKVSVNLLSEYGNKVIFGTEDDNADSN